jgi:hypothetical protein
MSKRCSVAFILAFVAFLAFADEGGLIEGEKWAFLVSPPAGWVRDSASLRSQGIQGLFYKAGSRFDPSELHIYISPSPKKEGGPFTLAEFVEADEESFMVSYPGILVKDLKPYAPGMGYVFTVRELDDANDGYYQELAYYAGDAAFFVFVLSCRSPEEREGERHALFELLDSFTYISKE